MLQIDSISKSFGGQTLLEDTGFQINPGERVGLVGRNGHGKTTLLNMITGAEHPDNGRITCPSGYRMGILSQTISFSQPSVLKETMLGLQEHEKDHYWKAEKLLAGLGFSPADMDRAPGLFSGGFQVRLNLAKVLVSAPNLLILDEPTNYLDITSIRWISKFLLSWAGEVLMVTHDRTFMDQVVTHIAGIHRKKIRKIQGNTAKYYEQVAQEEEIYEKTRVNQEKRTKEIQTFINRFRAKARLANMVQSRIKTLKKTKKKEKLVPIKQMDFSFSCLPFEGKQVMAAQDLDFSWQKDTPLIKNFSLVVYPEDRIAIIGQNGRGKTTLLKMLSQSLKPDAGTVHINPGVSMGYFEQTNIQSLHDSFTVEEELINAHPDFDRQAARNVCGVMMFEQDLALKKISVLSGGEKSRVMLGKLLLTPLNLLLLDEPTNHLDMESCDAFVTALDQFDGAIILVSHNEMFLHGLANRLVVFKNDEVFVFEGTYQEFLEKEGWEEQEAVSPKKAGAIVNKKELRRQKSRIIAQRSKEVGPIQKKISQLEDQIEEQEVLAQSLGEKLAQASQDQDGEKIQILSRKLAKAQDTEETLFSQLEQYMEELATRNKKFESQLAMMENESIYE